MSGAGGIRHPARGALAGANADRMRKRHADRRAELGLRPDEADAFHALVRARFPAREAAAIIIRSRRSTAEARP